MDIRSYLLKNQFIAALLIIAIGMFLLEVTNIILLLFVCVILTSTLAPAVRFLKKYRVPKIVAIAILYVVIIAFLTLLIAPLVPFFIEQFQALLENFPRYIDQTAKVLHFNVDAAKIREIVGSQADTIGKNAFVVTSEIFGGFLSLITVLVISFYLLLDHDNIIKKLPGLFPQNLQQKVEGAVQEIESTLGAWFRGQITLSLFVGLFTWIALTAVGLPYALPLAVIAGMFEIVPTIGPILSAVPAIIIGFSISPTTALVVAGAFLVIQQLENNLLVPKIMEKAVGLHPVVVIIGVILGGKFAGILGALLSAPFISVLYILLKRSQK